MKMKKFKFHDNKKGQWIRTLKWVAPVVFECEAEDILKAQELYQKATGLEVTKQPFIGIDFK